MLSRFTMTGRAPFYQRRGSNNLVVEKSTFRGLTHNSSNKMINKVLDP